MKDLVDCILDEDYSCAMDKLKSIPSIHKNGYCMAFKQPRDEDEPPCEIMAKILAKAEVKRCGFCPFFVPREILQELKNENPDVDRVLVFLTEASKKMKRL